MLLESFFIILFLLFYFIIYSFFTCASILIAFLSEIILFPSFFSRSITRYSFAIHDDRYSR